MKLLTAIQPTNLLQIGNYFGALKPATELQREHKLFMMIADYHAITVGVPPKLTENIYFATAAYLAAGINPKKSVIFQQSQVPAHTELAWILETQTAMGEASRMTQFKDKAGAKSDRVSVGLFAYPMLMAADILLYDTEGVPVGEDQKQHVELTRDLAERFNKKFGETFTVPKPIIRERGSRIKALNDPEKKMSKSSPSAKSYLSIMDDEDLIAKKIRSAVTDSDPSITNDDARPGLKNLLTLFHLVTGEAMETIVQQYNGKGMKTLKDDLAEALILHLSPLQAEIKGWMDNKDELKKIIQIGSEGAATLADEKLHTVKKHLGIVL